MPRKRKVKFGFYRVELPAGSCPFHQLLQRHVVSRAPIDRNVDVEGGFNRIDKYGQVEAPGTWNVGLFLRLRSESDAVIGSLDSEVLEDLRLGEGEVLTEFFTFAYHPDTNVIAVQRNRDAGGVNNFLGYIETISGVKPIDLSIVPDSDPFERVRLLDEVREIQIRIANPRNIRNIHGQSLAGFIEAGQRSGTETISITLSMSHAPGTIPRETVEDAKEIIGNDQIDTQRAIIRGFRRSGQGIVEEVVDFMGNQLTTTIEYATENPGKITVDEAIFLAHRAMEANSDYLYGNFAQWDR